MCVCVCVSVCMSQLIGTRERKKQKIQINKSLHTNIMYVRTGTLRKWYFGIFFKEFIHTYVQTYIHLKSYL